ncbi:methyltransferase [Desulfobacula phenolica]|uniref:Dimerisation domain-containing protein n=1 Tax=Desulfobacula phenolica TaxID=90732 RepID=A0A1H2GN00_9BACT|nr:methyltransferase [Desulfobacula phenolica]SDU20915.1 Dimerisation domain-containing protein [Desulfobacula phenolica]
MSLPQVNVSPEKLYRMCYASVQSSLLLTGIKLKVFNHLSKPQTADQLARVINGHPKNTMLFLNGLVACDLLLKKRGIYSNTPIAQTFLVEGYSTSLGKGFIHQGSMYGLMPEDLSTLVLNGPPSLENRMDTGEKWGHNATWMANNERSGIAQQMSDIVSALPEFSSFEKMLDLGGGPGIFGIAIVDKHPTMKGTVFDQKPVVEVAKGFIREYGLESRIDVLAGDFNKDSLGKGYDLIWASSTLNFAQNNMEKVMKKIHEALNPKGVFINLSEGLTHEGTKPDFFVFCTLVWAMQNPMRPFDQGVIADAMLNAGFKTVKSRILQTCWGQMDMDIARK